MIEPIPAFAHFFQCFTLILRLVLKILSRNGYLVGQILGVSQPKEL